MYLSSSSSSSSSSSFSPLDPHELEVVGERCFDDYRLHLRVHREFRIDHGAANAQDAQFLQQAAHRPLHLRHDLHLLQRPQLGAVTGHQRR